MPSFKPEDENGEEWTKTQKVVTQVFERTTAAMMNVSSHPNVLVDTRPYIRNDTTKSDSAGKKKTRKTPNCCNEVVGYVDKSKDCCGKERSDLSARRALSASQVECWRVDMMRCDCVLSSRASGLQRQLLAEQKLQSGPVQSYARWQDAAGGDVSTFRLGNWESLFRRHPYVCDNRETYHEL